MDNAPKRRHVAPHIGQDLLDHSRRTDVTTDRPHARALLLQRRDRLPRGVSGRPPPDQHEVAGAGLHQGARHRQAESAQSTGDQIRGIGPHPAGLGNDPCVPRLFPGERQHPIFPICRASAMYRNASFTWAMEKTVAGKGASSPAIT